MEKILDWLDWFFSQVVSRPKVQLFMDVTLILNQIITVILLLRLLA